MANIDWLDAQLEELNNERQYKWMDQLFYNFIYR